MNSRFWVYILVALGLATLVSFWGSVTRAMTTSEESEGRVISRWSTSGSPQKDRMHTRRFVYEVNREAEQDPDIEPLQANLYFSTTGSRDDVVFVSFLSGNPPDIVDFWMSQLDDAVAAGQIMALDELIEREDRIRARMGLEQTFIESLNGGEQSVVRFYANPNDWRLRAWQEDGSYTEEAARLLGMHGKVIGFNPPGHALALTYNGRLFEEVAASGGEYAVLVGADGEARPPETWTELRHFARLITKWGIEKYGKENKDRPFGLTVQGQDEDFFMRAITPLACTAGCRDFDFSSGRYAFDHPAIRGAYKLLMLIRQDGSVRPGTAQRLYEITRAELSQGKAGMLIDGWHAAMIAAQKNPAVKEDIGSAPIPVPWRDEAERAEITGTLGFAVGRGAWLRDGGGSGRITCITTGSEHPDAAWDWLYREKRSTRTLRSSMLEHRVLPSDQMAAYYAFESPEPEWVAFREKLLPFQFQAWDFIQRTQVWPTPPSYTIIQELPDHKVAMRQGFLKIGDGCPPQRFEEIMTGVEKQLATYTEEVNKKLSQLEERGEREPASYTFSDWDPRRAGEFYVRQVTRTDPERNREIAALEQKLPPELQGFNRMTRPAAWPLLLAILGLILGTIGIFILWQRCFGAGRRPGGMGELATEARTNWHAYVFVAPAVLALFVFVIYPAIYQFALSVHSGTGQTALRYVGLENYATAFTDGKFWGEAIPNTLLYMVTVAICEVAAGLLLGCLLNLGLRGMSIYRTLFFVPMVVSISVVAVIFFGLLSGPDSTLNGVLDALGFYSQGSPLNWVGQSIGLLDAEGARVDWLNDERVALFTLMGVAIWQGLPFNTILCLAGLQSIPNDLYEAAKVDGAGARSRFLRITIPCLAPILLIILFNSLIGAARHFGNVYILTKGANGTELVSTYVFKQGFEWNESALPNVGYACTLSILYACLLAGFIVINVIYVGRRLRRRFGGGRGGTPAEEEA